MKVINKKIEELKPYERNPRNNDEAIEGVVNSIQEFGFKVPIVVDTEGTIISGHTRYKAAKKLGLTQIPCIVADDLSKKQIKAFRIADNKVSEKATWNYGLLEAEITDLMDMDFNLDILGFNSQELEDITEELNISDEDFIQDTEIVKEKPVKKCPNCGYEL